MSIRVVCTCGKVLKVDEKHAGKKGKCPACGAAVEVPVAPAAEAPKEPAPSPETPPPPESTPAPQPPSQEVLAGTSPPTEPLAEDSAAPPAAPGEKELPPGHPRLEQLVQRMRRLPEPGDRAGELLHKAAVLTAMMVASGASNHTLTSEKWAFYLKTINQMAERFGEDDERVRILRAMHAIALAVMEGRPEPSDKELGLTGGCFIATAACGTDQAADVVRLRECRDTVLLASPAGRAFVRLYERVSPPIARVIGASPSARDAVRRLVVRPARCAAEAIMRVRKNGR